MKLIRRITRRLRDRRGNITIAATVGSAAMILTVGAGVEIAGLHQSTADLQRAVDAAALAAARYIPPVDETPSSREDAARGIFEAYTRTLDLKTKPVFGFSEKDGQYTVTGQAKRDTEFLNLAQVPYFSIEVSATAERLSGPIEVALVLDATNSITKEFPDAQTLLGETLDQMQGLASKPEAFRVSYVPFSDRVRLGDLAENFLDRAEPAGWGGCLVPREEALPGFPYGLTDAPPVDGSRFTPSTSDTDSAWAVKWGLTCRNQVVALTSNVETVRSELLATSVAGTGRFDVPLAWAWRLLSPRWRDHWGDAVYPLDYGEGKKVAIMITDGLASTNRPTPDGLGDMGGGGGRNQVTQLHIDHYVELCRKMLEKGIELHLITPDRRYEPFVDGMKACAALGATLHEAADSVDLSSALDQVVSSVRGEARLVK